MSLNILILWGKYRYKLHLHLRKVLVPVMDSAKIIFKDAKQQAAVEIEDIRVLSKVSSWRGLFAVFSEWLIMFAAILFSIRFNNLPAYFLAWIIIGTRMYALYSLLHDGIHYLLFPNKQVNDWICRLFLCWPLFISLNRIRKFHLAHHQYLKTPDDPEAVHLQYKEFQFPLSSSGLAFTFLKDISGFNFLFYKGSKILRSLSPALNSKKDQNKNTAGAQGQFDWGMVLYYTVIAVTLIYWHQELRFVTYWIVPYITIYQVLNRIRLSTEHFHLPEEKLFQTRTVKLNLAERIVFSPHNLGYHTEHHLYPSVPFYRLPALHKKLMDAASYRDNIVVSKSYFQVIKEYVK